MAATVAYTEWKLGNCHYVKLRIFLRLLLRAEWNEVDEIWERHRYKFVLHFRKLAQVGTTGAQW